MKTPQPKPPRRAPRPVRVPPPLTRGRERFEGSSVLTEYQGELGVLLWQSLRNVLLWTETDPARRKGLFPPGAEERRRVKLGAEVVVDALRAPLGAIARLLADPVGADKKRVATACQKVAEWAENQGSLATALAYMQAAALSSNDARQSYEVGHLARQRGEYPRAETWFRRAILLGRQGGDWESYSLAFIGLGSLYMQRGNLPAAQRAHMRAFRASRRKGLRKVQAMALHEMFVIALERNQVREAEELAAAALRAYGPGHPRLPSFAHDVALFWTDRGYHAPATTVLTALLPHIRRPADQVKLLASLARAAAGANEPAIFEEAWERSWELNSEAGQAEKTAWAFQSLATSAASMGQWDKAAHAAERALQIATERQETQIRNSAETLLASIREKTISSPADMPALEPWVSHHAEELAASLARSLKAGGAAR
jgi:tetratricopeptide (TPR) repeat protein